MSDGTDYRQREIAAMMNRAAALEADFRRSVETVPYEAKGVFYSEFLFLLAALGDLRPRQLLESGRARGQSTFLLGKFLPDVSIISVDYRYDDVDAPVAKARTRDLHNVALLFGDSRKILPTLLLEGDVAFIDGPKGIAALHLALDCLATGRCEKVFVHDCYRGQGTRYLMERYLPGAFFSDEAEFVKCYADLDARCWVGKYEVVQDGHYDRNDPARSYGPTMACIPHVEGVDYRGLARKLRLAEPIYRKLSSATRHLPFIASLPRL